MSVVESLDLSQYIPPEIAGAAGDAINYYNQVQGALQNVNVTKGSNGWPVVTLSPKATAIAAGIINGAVYTVPVLGQAYALLMAFAPQAGAGPGVCSTDPPHVVNPKAPTHDELAAWPHFVSWTKTYGNYPMPENSFEAYADPILQWNWELQSNCFMSAASPAPVLLAGLIHSWNQAHADTSTATVTRMGLVGGNPSVYDPISYALDAAFAIKYSDGTAFGYTGPYDVTTSFQINTGPIKIQPLTLHFPTAPSAPVPAAPSTVKTATGVVAATAGTAILAGIAWGLATGKAWDWAFSTAWAEIKDMAGAKEAHEAFEETIGVSERSGSATQTLLFSRRKYDASSAKAWARAHGYRSGKVDVTANYIRLRQRDPGRFRRLRTVTFSKDIKAVIGPLK